MNLDTIRTQLPKVRDLSMYFKTFFIRLLTVLAYSFIGAAVFYFLEQPNTEDYEMKTNNFSSLINNIKSSLHENISSCELIRLSKDLRNLATSIDSKMKQSNAGITDKYFTWVYFCLTTIMTIGKYF